MGVVKNNSINPNMKFLGALALVGLVAAMPNFQKDSKRAQQEAQKVFNQVGLNQQKINKGVNRAQAEMKKGVNQAEAFAKKNGVTVDLQSVFDKLEAQYGKQAQQMAKDAQKNGIAQYNQRRRQGQQQLNGSQFKNAQKKAQNANFQTVLNNASKALLAQTNKVGNTKVRANLKNILNQATKQAGVEMKNAGLTGNIRAKAIAEGNKAWKKNNGQKQLDEFQKKAIKQIKGQVRRV